MSPISQLPAGVGIVSPIPILTALPASATTGTMIVYTDSLTAPTYRWSLVYNGNSSSSYKWECVGGDPKLVHVETMESTTSSTYVALATAQSFNAPVAGDYHCRSHCTHYSAGLGYYGYMGLHVNGVLQRESFAASNYWSAIGHEVAVTGITSGHAIALLWHSTSGFGANFFQRSLAVMPKRVG